MVTTDQVIELQSSMNDIMDRVHDGSLDPERAISSLKGILKLAVLPVRYELVILP